MMKVNELRSSSVMNIKQNELNISNYLPTKGSTIDKESSLNDRAKSCDRYKINAAMVASRIPFSRTPIYN
jgi:hypothetical protein